MKKYTITLILEDDMREQLVVCALDYALGKYNIGGKGICTGNELERVEGMDDTFLIKKIAEITHSCKDV